MNIQEILEQIDVLYSQQKVEEVERLVLEKIEELQQNKEVYPTIMLQNELLGIYREKGDKEKGLDCCGEILFTFKNYNLPRDDNFATTLLNIATAYRAFGEYKRAQKFYNECFDIYNGSIDKNDYRFASLYNNLSLLYVEMGEPDEAIKNLEKSLEILSNIPQAEIPVATANTSLSQIHMGKGDMESAKKHINIAIDIFEQFDDYHYSATLSTAGDIAYYEKDYTKSVELYKKSMGVIEKFIGKTQNYYLVEENMKNAQQHITTDSITSNDGNDSSSSSSNSDKGLGLSKAFYTEYGIPMLEKDFASYIDKIAVGLVGYGSECFGFDDQLSHDHDFGAGFCLWLTDEVYNEIGEKLQQEYDKLPTTYKGVTRISHENCANEQKVGVFKIGNFYKNIIGTKTAPTTQKDWLAIEESALATATNGEIYRDDLGEFTKIRNSLNSHYPKELLTKKLAQTAHIVSQTGQYNFKRTLQRKDLVTARIVLSEFITNTIDIIFLLNKTFTPFYKWKYKKLAELPLLSTIATDIAEIEKLAIEDEKVQDIIEQIVSKIIVELKSQGYINSNATDNFLDLYINEILGEQAQINANMDEKMELVEKIVALEWSAFDKVQGTDGRAVCQDDFETFNIMRSSQYMAWTTDLLLSYIDDFEKANEIGRNLITEKYAVMMKTTDFENYKTFEHQLPKLPAEQVELIEIIVAKQVELMATLRPIYPKLSNNSRILRTSEDSIYDTSYETYLRGELHTHSLKTNQLYNQLLDDDKSKNINTVMLYILNTAKLYGYQDLETAEASL